MKIKLIVDSTDPLKARVVNAETGELMRGVAKVDLHIGMGEPSRLTIEVLDFAAEVNGDAEVVSVDAYREVPGDNSVLELKPHNGQESRIYRRNPVTC